MGGGRQFPYPKWVWSPSGGWWPSPPNWKRNTLIYCVFMAGVCSYTYVYAEARTITYTPKFPVAEHHDESDEGHGH